MHVCSCVTVSRADDLRSAIPDRTVLDYVEDMSTETTTFHLSQTVEEKDGPAAREAMQAFLDDVTKHIPSAIVSEITTQPAAEDRSIALHYTESTPTDE